MKSTARLVVCALTTLALMGIGASTGAFAADAHHRGHRAHHGTRHGHTHHHSRLEQDGSSRVLRALGRLDRRLVLATSAHRLAPLTEADRDALLNNAEADEAAVGAVATSYSTSPTTADLSAAKTTLKGFRPVRYVSAATIVLGGEQLAAQITALESQVTSGSTDAADLTQATTLLAAHPASGFTATTSKASMQSARSALAQARALVGQVDADLGIA